jgi:hypothetical protein
MSQTWFTPTSARVALERVRPVAERIRRLYRALEQHHPPAIGADQPVEAGYFTILARYAQRVEQLGRHGVRLGDPRDGAVEFPARRSGRAVCLCWRVGEPGLAFWRDPGEGVAARRLLEDDDGPWDDPW